MRTIGVAVSAAALAIAAACGTEARHEARIASLRVGVPAPVLLASTGSVALRYHRNALTKETLVALGDDGRPMPRVIESWESEPGGLVWRLRLRDGVRFHDGTPVTANEIAPDVSRALTAVSLGAVKDVTAESQKTLVIRLNEPYAFLFEDLSFISAQRTTDGKVFDTGPFVVSEESPERLLLTAVEDHYRGRPDVAQVEVRLFPDQRNAWSALMRDQIDMLYEVSPDSLEFVRSESSIRVATFPRPYVYLFGMNAGDSSLSNSLVRRALNLGVDRDALIRTAMAGEGQPAYGHIWPGHWAYDSSAGSGTFDQTAALRLLESAGLPIKTRAGRMPSRLRIKCMVYAPLHDMALVLQRQLAEIDVDLDLEVLPTQQFLERLTKGQYQSFVFEMTSARSLKWPYQFWHSKTPFLKHGYSGADDILDRMRRAATEEELRSSVVAFQRRVHDDPPAVFLAWGRTSRAVSTRVEIPAGDDDIYHTIARWKLAPKGN